MKLDLSFDQQPITVNFDPQNVVWKSQNYGQYSHQGVRFPEVDAPVFIKRHREVPESCDLLCSLLEQGPPVTSLPSIYGFLEFEGVKDGFLCYIFMEMVRGAPLQEIIRSVGKEDCYEIMRSVFLALEAIVGMDHWYPDLDFRNIMFYKRGRTTKSRLIDIDSCLPGETTFVDFLRNRGSHTNVNERYWGCVVPMAKERDNFEALSGKTVTQAAFAYFALDLYFRISYPENPFNLKPKEIFKLMESPSQYIDKSTQEIWQAIHEELAENPEEGCGWEALDDFVVSLFGFGQALNPPEAGEGIWDRVVGMAGRWLSFLKG